MDFVIDPLNVNSSHKTAIIYRISASNYSYACYHCNCSFNNISDTLDHIETHFNDNGDDIQEESKFSIAIPDTKIEQIYSTDTILSNLTCQLCEECFESQDVLDQHMKSHINIIEYRCKLCQRHFSTTAELLTHVMEMHLNTTVLVCPICCENFISKDTFKRHLHAHIMTDDVNCDSLIEGLLSKYEICVKLEVEEYVPYIRIGKILQCDICESSFDKKYKLRLHMKETHITGTKDVVKSGSYKCDKCNRNIHGKMLFYAHQYEHLISGNKRTVEISDSTLIQNLKTFLDANIMYDELAPATPYGCNICCHLSVKRRHNIEAHICQEHVYRIKSKKNKEKRYPCEFCGQKFALSSNLIVHKRIHTLERPYTCSICNKSFSHSSYMKYHERVHTGVRPHQCSTCGLSFKSTTKLNVHNKVHSTEIAKCPICHKEIKPHRLNVHIKNVHENEHRPYKCPVCLQAFKTSKTLRTHSYRHSGEKKYECRFQCKERFTSSSGRRGHERSKHEAH